jgi:hypothetical protein
MNQTGGMMKQVSRAMMVLLSVPCTLYAQKDLYLSEIKKAEERGWRENPRIVQQWRTTSKPNVLWGYDAPANPVYLASTLAFLYEHTGEKEYAERASGLLASYGDLRDVLPKDYPKSRIEYADGVPALSNFFFLPPYVRAYMRIRDSGVMDAKVKAKIEKEIAGSVDFIFHFPEWGTHNRAVLRAEALLYAYRAFPRHPHAEKWRKMAEIIAGDNIHNWEIEDASLYNPVWLYSLFSYAEAANRPDVYRSPMIHYYLDYYAKLIAPSGTIPDFGDAGWNSTAGALRFVAIFEKGAAVYKDPTMKWAAQSILHTVTDRMDTVGLGEAYSLTDAYRWTDESVLPVRPTSLSQEALCDVVGKKVVFRNGWADSSMYMLVNYCDEGNWGWLYRDYLRNTITVEQEKMTHGHADENSIVLLMNKGSVLLHDAGYRDSLPSGKYGAFRADYFHNRVVVRKDKRDTYQDVLAFVQNYGAYRPVETRRIDFLTLKDVDMSCTRVIDNTLGYQWDRSITYVRDPGYFVVIDGIKALHDDYFTYTNFWHAQTIRARGEHFFDVATDSVPGYKFSPNQSLLIYFPGSDGKVEGSSPIRRHWQMEQALYQSVASSYLAGDYETFITILYPHDRGADPKTLIPSFKVLETSAPGKAVALEITNRGTKQIIFVRLDREMELSHRDIRPRYLYDLGKVSFASFETDAPFMYAAVNSSTVRYSAAEVLKVKYKDRMLLEALPNTHGLQPDGSPDRVAITKWRYWEDEVPLK